MKKVIIKTLCLVFAAFVALTCFFMDVKAETIYNLDVPNLTVLPGKWGELKVKMYVYDTDTKSEKSIYKERFDDYDMTVDYEVIKGDECIGLDTLGEGKVYGIKEGTGKVKITVIVQEYDDYEEITTPVVYERTVNVTVKIKDFASYCKKEGCLWLEKVKNKNEVYLCVTNPTNKNMVIKPTNMIAKQPWTRSEKNALLEDVVVEKGTNKYNTKISKKVTVKPGQTKKIKVEVGPKSNINANYATYLYFNCEWNNKVYQLKASK